MQCSSSNRLGASVGAELCTVNEASDGALVYSVAATAESTGGTRAHLPLGSTLSPQITLVSLGLAPLRADAESWVVGRACLPLLSVPSHVCKTDPLVTWLQHMCDASAYPNQPCPWHALHAAYQGLGLGSSPQTQAVEYSQPCRSSWLLESRLRHPDAEWEIITIRSPGD